MSYMEYHSNAVSTSNYNKKNDEIAISLKNVISDTILFSETYRDYCVCIVDAVNSTKITSSLSKPKMCRYYSIFLNTMSLIAKEYGASIVKNIGDSILYYFPETSDISNKPSFVNSIECSMSMIESHSVVNKMMHDDELPSVDYRISADYGSIMTAKTAHSSIDDVFGSTVNICSKINSLAAPNSVVIGGDLFMIIQSFTKYKFKAINWYSAGLKLQYPVYSIMRNGSY